MQCNSVFMVTGKPNSSVGRELDRFMESLGLSKPRKGCPMPMGSYDRQSDRMQTFIMSLSYNRDGLRIGQAAQTAYSCHPV